ncbi:DUF4251 domain-containing protein [Pedobacter sp. MW01-1-1]|uniref:DUF4251 domain-containing protein n=1 Tax=Pedobacter sp. MW01-1-1 TaxID=3383027 RepID=UPI003FED6653
MKNLSYFFGLALLLFSNQIFAQTDKETTNRIVKEKNYVFVANTAIPMNTADMSRIMARMPGGNGGGTINLTGSQYEFKVAPDSLIAYLPYFGRAYSAPYPSSTDDSGIKFTSKDYTYKSSKNKKGNYTIQINTKDVKIENYQITIDISQNGYATLIATGVNKQPITFNGYLRERKKTEAEEKAKKETPKEEKSN